MDLININKTDLYVSPICMGTAVIGSILNEKESFKRLDMFYEAGGRFFDTSNVYADWIDGIEKSVSEKTIGRWMKRTGATAVVATKGGHGELTGAKIGKTRLSKNELNVQIQQSLDNLCVNSISLYYLHRDDTSMPVESIMDTMFENMDKGYIKNIGCTNWSLERLSLANAYAKKCGRVGFAVSSDRWSLARFKPDKDPSIVPFDEKRFDYIKENNLTEIPFQSMGRGTISLIANNRRPEENYDIKENYVIAKNAARIAEKYGTTVAAVSIAYLVNQGINVVPIMFFDNAQQIQEAFYGASLKLSEEETVKLRSLSCL